MRQRSCGRSQSLVYALVIVFILPHSTYCTAAKTKDDSNSDYDIRDEVVRMWSPLVWFAPDEEFFPLSVNEFLQRVTAIPANITGDHVSSFKTIPLGPGSEDWYLVTDDKLIDLRSNRSSYIYGQNPTQHSVPIYAVISPCFQNAQNEIKTSIPRKRIALTFHVTYWMFFPYNEGKEICTYKVLSTHLPLPVKLPNCRSVQYGNHVGDWEHVSLMFDGETVPKSMYISTHDAGAYYAYNSIKHAFVYMHQETRKGIVQKPKFPEIVTVRETHPVLFSAKGSHGIWAAPGQHEYIRMPRLWDENGYGTPWRTWLNVDIIDPSRKPAPSWMSYYGRWGNRRANCSLRLSFNLCQLADGPSGIPMKKNHYDCQVMLGKKRPKKFFGLKRSLRSTPSWREQLTLALNPTNYDYDFVQETRPLML